MTPQIRHIFENESDILESKVSKIKKPTYKKVVKRESSFMKGGFGN